MTSPRISDTPTFISGSTALTQAEITSVRHGDETKTVAVPTPSMPKQGSGTASPYPLPPSQTAPEAVTTSSSLGAPPSTHASPHQAHPQSSPPSPCTGMNRHSPRTSHCMTWVESCTNSINQWSEELQRKAEERQNARQDRIHGEGDTPDPLWKRKGMIVVVGAILAWVYIVYVWRICVPAIEQRPPPSSASSLLHPRPLSSRRSGIILLVLFHVIFLLTIWAYVKVILTGPGFVKDHVQKEAMPRVPGVREMMMYPHQQQPQGGVVPHIGQPIPDAFNVESQEADPNASTIALRDEEQDYQQEQQDLGAQSSATDSVAHDIPTDELPIDPALPAAIGPIGAALVATSSPSGSSILADVDQRTTVAPAAAPQPILNPMAHDQSQQPPSRIPPSPDYPPLARTARYCHRCSHVKPPRAHHCRHCRTCIEKMDHHCPWVGGCVGGGNHKFFLNFVFWVTVLEFFVLISSGVLFHRGVDGTVGGWTVDGFVISLFPICVIFLLFTFSLLMTHTWLILTNQTTLEHLGTSKMARREEVALMTWFSRKGGWAKSRGLQRQDLEGGNREDSGTQHEKPNGSRSQRWNGFQMIKERREMKRSWDREWGRLRIELNPWKVEVPVSPNGLGDGSFSQDEVEPRYRRLTTLGSLHANWCQTMGSSPLGWLFPIGRPGLDPSRKTRAGTWEVYPLNPRFGPQGQWRRRDQWPRDLR